MTLSPRETQIALLVADRLSDNEIADLLAISIHTVRAHLDRMANKLKTDDHLSRRRVIRDWVKAM